MRPIVLMVFLSVMACGQSPQEIALDKLKKQQVVFSIEEFFTAVKTGDIELVETFLDAGMPIDIVFNQYTALFSSLFYGRDDIATLLIDRGANVNFKNSSSGVMKLLEFLTIPNPNRGEEKEEYAQKWKRIHRRALSKQ